MLKPSVVDLLPLRKACTFFKVTDFFPPFMITGVPLKLDIISRTPAINQLLYAIVILGGGALILTPHVGHDWMFDNIEFGLGLKGAFDLTHCQGIKYVDYRYQYQ